MQTGEKLSQKDSAAAPEQSRRATTGVRTLNGGELMQALGCDSGERCVKAGKNLFAPSNERASYETRLKQGKGEGGEADRDEKFGKPLDGSSKSKDANALGELPALVARTAQGISNAATVAGAASSPSPSQGIGLSPTVPSAVTPAALPTPGALTASPTTSKLSSYLPPPSSGANVDIDVNSLPPGLVKKISDGLQLPPGLLKKLNN
jgi:hypothetical protein